MRYVGNELATFAHATNFHDYYLRLFGPYLRGDVLEVGAGLGTFTRGILARNPGSLTACEPDEAMAQSLAGIAPGRVHLVVGGLRDIPSERGPFDAVVYVDVLEHIEDDRAEVLHAASRLKPGGVLIIGGPAHQWLYSPFDKAIGHYRRYDRASINKLLSGSELLRLELFRYIDSLGVALSLGNRWLGRQASPTSSQIKFWNDWVLPMSKRIDPWLGYQLGKSFVAIARRGEH